MIEILPLSQVPEYAAILAYWSFRLWYMERDINFSLVLAAYRQRAGSSDIPLSFVACEESFPVGMVSLKMDDLWNRKDLNPWLASLYVLPEYRKRGIAGSLMDAVVTTAARQCHRKIYLFLGQEEQEVLDHFYRKRGWLYEEEALDNDGKATKIYSKNLS